MSAEQNRAVAIKFLTTMKDHGGLDESLITDDFQWWSPGLGTTDAAKLKSYVASASARMPRLPEMTVVGTTAEGDRVAVELEGKCALTNGRRYDNTYHFLLQLRNGRVQLVKEYCDTKLARDAFSES